MKNTNNFEQIFIRNRGTFVNIGFIILFFLVQKPLTLYISGESNKWISIGILLWFFLEFWALPYKIMAVSYRLKLKSNKKNFNSLDIFRKAWILTVFLIIGRLVLWIMSLDVAIKDLFPNYYSKYSEAIFNWSMALFFIKEVFTVIRMGLFEIKKPHIALEIVADLILIFLMQGVFMAFTSIASESGPLIDFSSSWQMIILLLILIFFLFFTFFIPFRIFYIFEELASIRNLRGLISNLFSLLFIYGLFIYPLTYKSTEVEKRMLLKLDKSKNTLIFDNESGRLRNENLKNLCQYSDLKKLTLTSVFIDWFPDCFSSFTQLKELNISNNQFTRVPPVISFINLSRLEVLNISKNKITYLPTPEKPHVLKKYIASNNQINMISSKVKHFTKLQEFNLAYNQLKSLPKELATLKELKALDLSANPFEEIPPVLLKLKTLKVLKLKNTNFSKVQKKKIQEELNQTQIYF